MAKQRGIHQISGKINNLCYYEQKYVRGGLIRRINEAMSERLKTDPVFANTRVANKIFGGCSIAAAALLEFFGSRSTYLFKPYRHAILTRAVQKYFLEKDSEATYPSIISTLSSYNYLSQVIDSIVKNSIFNEFNELRRQLGYLSINDEYPIVFRYQDLVRFCKKNECIGVQLSISPARYIYAVNYDVSVGSYVVPETNAGGRLYTTNWYLDSNEQDVEIMCSTGSTDDAATFWILYAIPIKRTIGGRPVTGQTGACCGISTYLINS